MRVCFPQAMGPAEGYGVRVPSLRRGSRQGDGQVLHEPLGRCGARRPGTSGSHLQGRGTGPNQPREDLKLANLESSSRSCAS